jgi:hypothetical protein
MQTAAAFQAIKSDTSIFAPMRKENRGTGVTRQCCATAKRSKICSNATQRESCEQNDELSQTGLLNRHFYRFLFTSCNKFGERKKDSVLLH